MKLLEKLDKAILDMENQQYGFALSTLMEIRSQLTPEFEIGEKVILKHVDDQIDFCAETRINDLLISLKNDHIYYHSPDSRYILSADDIKKFGDE